MRRLDKWIDENTKSLSGKTVAISGATGGLGRRLCRRLCSLGASLILLDRNGARSAALAEELETEYPHRAIERISLDLEDMERVREVARTLEEMEVDILILNAGAYSIPRHKCTTGYDNVFQINFLSPYYLAKMLLPKLRARGGRVVVVSSIAHNYSHIDRDDVDFSTRRAASKVYGNAKRWLTYCLMGEQGVAITHPGIAVTGITGHYPKLVYALIKYPMKLIFMSPDKACLSILSGVFGDTPYGEWLGPRVFNVWGLPRRKRLPKVDGEEVEFCRGYLFES